MRTLASLLLVAATIAVHADVTGTWTTFDDEMRKPSSTIEIYERDGEYFGRIQSLLSRPDDVACDACQGSLKGQPIRGMEIIAGMKEHGGQLSGGTILDPDTGKVYRGKLWLEDENTLRVRGYLGMFFGTQTWLRSGE